MKGLWPAVVAIAAALLVSGCIVPDFLRSKDVTSPQDFKAKAMDALKSVRSYNYATQSVVTILPLPVSGPSSGQTVSPLRTVSIEQGTADNNAGSIIESSWDTDAVGGTTTAVTAVVGDFVYTKNLCTGGWSKKRITPAEIKQFIGEQDHMSNFTAQLFDVSALEWKEKTRLEDRDVHVVRVVPDKEKLRSLLLSSTPFSENIESFDATYWLETDTLYPVKGQVTMTFNIPPSGSEPGYSVEIKGDVEYSDHNRVAVALPREAGDAQEAAAGTEGILKDTIYTHKAGFSICPPQGWSGSSQALGSNPLLSLFATEKDAEGVQTVTANIKVGLRPLPEGGFDAAVKLTKEGITQEAEAQLISEKAVPLVSGQGHLFEVTTSESGTKVRLLALLAPNPADKNTGFMVMFVTLNSAWGKHRDAVMASLLNFQPKTSPTPGISPPSINPSIVLVELPAQQLLLTAEQFPLPGYSLTYDHYLTDGENEWGLFEHEADTPSAYGVNGRGLVFEGISESSEFGLLTPRVYQLDAPPKSFPSAYKGGEIAEKSIVEAPALGDYAIACKMIWGGTPVFRYRVYTRNVIIDMDAHIKDTSLSDEQVLGLLASLIQYQIVAIDRATASLNFQTTASPTKSPEPVNTVQPSPAPTTPTVNLVKLPPQQLVLTTNQFPLPGYSVIEAADDVAFGKNGWSRTFKSTGESKEYWWVHIYADQLDAPPKEAPSVSDACRWGGEVKSISAVDASVVGDYVIACKITLPTAAPVFRYYVYTRNVVIYLDANIRDTSLPDDQVLDFLASLAQYQIATIDRASPPSQVITTTGTPKFTFTAPNELTMTPGEYFKYSFCDPEPATPTSPCGPMPETRNPTGGNPSYHFVLGSGTGFPPFGLSLSKDGVLKGTVSKTEAGKIRTIEVCAIDLSADAVCRKVTINVKASPPAPVCNTPIAQYQNTAWSGSFKVSYGATYSGTFKFTFGSPTADCESVPVVSGQVMDGSRTWELDTTGNKISCAYKSGCKSYDFFLRFRLASGPSKIGNFEVDPLEFDGDDYSRETGHFISPTQIGGGATAGNHYWGLFTASRN